MPACICKNCGQPNFIVGGSVPSRMKCGSCGNSFNTAGTVSGGPAPSAGYSAREQADLAEIRRYKNKERDDGIAVVVCYGISVVIAFFVFCANGNGYAMAALKAVVWPLVWAYSYFAG